MGHIQKQSSFYKLKKFKMWTCFKFGNRFLKGKDKGNAMESFSKSRAERKSPGNMHSSSEKWDNKCF